MFMNRRANIIRFIYKFKGPKTKPISHNSKGAAIIWPDITIYFKVKITKAWIASQYGQEAKQTRDIGSGPSAWFMHRKNAPLS